MNKMGYTTAKLIVGLSLILSVSAAHAGMEIFVKFGDKIDGESVDKEHEQWCEALAVGLAVDRELSMVAGTARRVSAGADAAPVSVTKEVDSASPYLLEAAFTGELIPEVTIEYRSQDSESPKWIMTLRLTDVVVAGFQQAGGSGSDRVNEIVSLAYESIWVKYERYDIKGHHVADSEMAYNVLEQRSQ